MQRVAAVAVLLFLASCAPKPYLPPEALVQDEVPLYEALFSYEAKLQKRTYRGRVLAVLGLSYLYLEGLSSFGTPLFSVWIEEDELYLLPLTKGTEPLLLKLEDAPYELKRLLSFVLMGKVPADLLGGSPVRIFKGGYVVRSYGRRLEVSCAQETLFEVYLEDPLRIKVPAFDLEARLKLLSKRKSLFEPPVIPIPLSAFEERTFRCK